MLHVYLAGGAVLLCASCICLFLQSCCSGQCCFHAVAVNAVASAGVEFEIFLKIQLA